MKPSVSRVMPTAVEASCVRFRRALSPTMRSLHAGRDDMKDSAVPLNSTLQPYPQPYFGPVTTVPPAGYAVPIVLREEEQRGCGKQR